MWNKKVVLTILFAVVLLSGAIPLTGLTNTQATPSIPVTYPVTFTESGLNPGAIWNLAIRSISGPVFWNATSNKTTVSGWLSPGEYSYAASAIGYVASPSLGWINVINTTVSTTIIFSQHAYYNLNITEVGIPGGVTSYINISNGSGSTVWAPIFLGTVKNVTNVSVFEVSFPDGKYNFSIIAPSGYIITGVEEFIGNLTSLSIHPFYFLATTTFNGSFTLDSFGNYTNYQHGNFSGNGSAVRILVFFAIAVVAHHPPRTEFPWWTVFLIVVIVVILVLIPAIVYAGRRRHRGKQTQPLQEPDDISKGSGK